MKKYENKIFFFLVLSLLILNILLVVYFQKATFFTGYDVSYWKDRVEHSQWVLPGSSRIIGDDGLFAYIGYGLIHGEDPSKLNAENPPIGKYILGLSTIVFGNPAFSGLFFGIGSLFVFYKLSKTLLKNTLLALSMTTVFSLDPLFITQLFKPSLDMIQIFFLLLHVYLFALFLDRENKNNWVLAFFSGLALGFFTQVKVPILLPVLLVVEFFICVKEKLIRQFIVLIGATGLAVLVSYSRYFLVGHSIVDFIKLQKYMVSFFKQSRLETHIGAILEYFFMGQFPDLATGKIVHIQEWSLLWPLVGIVGIIYPLILLARKNSFLWKLISLYTILGIAVFTFIPAYPRYMLLLIPFLYLLFAKFLLDYKIRHLFIFLCVGLIVGFLSSFSFYFPNPSSTLNTFYYSFSHEYFQDVYEENLSHDSKPFSSRGLFYTRSKKVLDDATVKDIRIKELSRSFLDSNDKARVRVLVTYKTQNLGKFSEEKNISLVKENNEWKVIWNWDILLMSFKPSYIVKTTRLVGKRGQIIQNGKVQAQDTNGILISITPSKIDGKREQEMLQIISNISNIKAVALQNAYLENAIPGNPVPLVTLFTPLTDSIKEKLLSFPGVVLDQAPARIYYGDVGNIRNTFYNECCTRIYSSFNYQGQDGLEKKYDKILWGYDGGDIVIEDKDKRIVRTILHKNLKNGQDVIIE